MPQSLRTTPTTRSPAMKSTPTMDQQPSTGLKVLYQPDDREATVE